MSGFHASKLVYDYYSHIADVMRWLAHLDIRGASAEDAVWTVFYALVVRRPIREEVPSILREWDPKWWEMFVENHGQWLAKFDAPQADGGDSSATSAPPADGGDP